MPCLTNSFMASTTVASGKRLYTSGFMIFSIIVRSSLSGLASCCLSGVFLTKMMVRISATADSTTAATNAALTPRMPACTGSIVPDAVPVTNVSIDTRRAVPSEPDTWRSVLLTEVPWLSSLLSSAFMAHVVMGMLTSDSDAMRMV